MRINGLNPGSNPAPAPSAAPSSNNPTNPPAKPLSQFGAFLNGLFGGSAKPTGRTKLQWLRRALFERPEPTNPLSEPARQQIGLDEVLQSMQGPAFMFTIGMVTMLFGISAVVANIMAAKVWHLGPLNLDGGYFLFGVVYVTGDILVGVCGQKFSDRFAAWVAGINLIIYALFWVVDKLPGVTGVANINFTLILGFSGRVLIGSAIAFIISRKVNNWLYAALQSTAPESVYPDDEIRAKAERGLIHVQSSISSFVGRIADTAIFTLIAFFGRLDGGLMLKQMVGSFIAGWLLEAILRRVITVPAIDHLRREFYADPDYRP